MTSNCKRCGGTGYIVEDRNGSVYSRPCVCIATEKDTLLHRDSMIPDRYRNNCVLENFAVPGRTSPCRRLSLSPGNTPKTIRFSRRGSRTACSSWGRAASATPPAPPPSSPRNNAQTKSPSDSSTSTTCTGRSGRVTTARRCRKYDILTPLVETELLLVDELFASPPPGRRTPSCSSYRKGTPVAADDTYNQLSRRTGASGAVAHGEDRVRSRSRLREMCRTVVMNGDDYRNRRHRQ